MVTNSDIEGLPESPHLKEQLILDLFSLRTFYRGRTIPSGVGGISGSFPAGTDNVVFVAQRRIQWGTNDEAARGTRDVLGQLRIKLSTNIISTVNPMARLAERDEAVRLQMLLLAIEQAPSGGLAEALKTFLPFELACFPALSEHYLDESHQTPVRTLSATLMLAWMISARVA